MRTGDPTAVGIDHKPRIAYLFNPKLSLLNLLMRKPYSPTASALLCFAVHHNVYHIRCVVFAKLERVLDLRKREGVGDHFGGVHQA